MPRQRRIKVKVWLLPPRDAKLKRFKRRAEVELKVSRTSTIGDVLTKLGRQFKNGVEVRSKLTTAFISTLEDEVGNHYSITRSIAELCSDLLEGERLQVYATTCATFQEWSLPEKSRLRPASMPTPPADDEDSNPEPQARPELRPASVVNLVTEDECEPPPENEAFPSAEDGPVVEQQPSPSVHQRKTASKRGRVLVPDSQPAVETWEKDIDDDDFHWLDFDLTENCRKREPSTATATATQSIENPSLSPFLPVERKHYPSKLSAVQNVEDDISDSEMENDIRERKKLRKRETFVSATTTILQPRNLSLQRSYKVKIPSKPEDRSRSAILDARPYSEEDLYDTDETLSTVLKADEGHLKRKAVDIAESYGEGDHDDDGRKPSARSRVSRIPVMKKKPKVFHAELDEFDDSLRNHTSLPKGCEGTRTAPESLLPGLTEEPKDLESKPKGNTSNLTPGVAMQWVSWKSSTHQDVKISRSSSDQRAYSSQRSQNGSHSEPGLAQSTSLQSHAQLKASNPAGKNSSSSLVTSGRRHSAAFDARSISNASIRASFIEANKVSSTNIQNAEASRRRRAFSQTNNNKVSTSQMPSTPSSFLEISEQLVNCSASAPHAVETQRNSSAPHPGSEPADRRLSSSDGTEQNPVGTTPLLQNSAEHRRQTTTINVHSSIKVRRQQPLSASCTQDGETQESTATHADSMRNLQILAPVRSPTIDTSSDSSAPYSRDGSGTMPAATKPARPGFFTLLTKTTAEKDRCSTTRAESSSHAESSTQKPKPKPKQTTLGFKPLRQESLTMRTQKPLQSSSWKGKGKESLRANPTKNDVQSLKSIANSQRRTLMNGFIRGETIKIDDIVVAYALPSSDAEQAVNSQPSTEVPHSPVVDDEAFATAFPSTDGEQLVNLQPSAEVLGSPATEKLENPQPSVEVLDSSDADLELNAQPSPDVLNGPETEHLRNSQSLKGVLEPSDSSQSFVDLCSSPEPNSSSIQSSPPSSLFSVDATSARSKSSVRDQQISRNQASARRPALPIGSVFGNASDEYPRFIPSRFQRKRGCPIQKSSPSSCAESNAALSTPLVYSPQALKAQEDVRFNIPMTIENTPQVPLRMAVTHTEPQAEETTRAEPQTSENRPIPLPPQAPLLEDGIQEDIPGSQFDNTLSQQSRPKGFFSAVWDVFWG